MSKVHSYYRGKALKRIQARTYVDLVLDVRFPHFVEEIGLAVEDNLWRDVCLAEFPELQSFPLHGGMI